MLAGLSARRKLFRFLLLGVSILGIVGAVMGFSLLGLVLCVLYLFLSIWCVRAGNAFTRHAESATGAEDNLIDGMRGSVSFFSVLCLVLGLGIVLGVGLALSRM